MMIRPGGVRRLAVCGIFLLAAAAPYAAVSSAGSPVPDRPLAACPAGEYLDPKTFFCMPGQIPAAIDVAPGLSLPWQEQDVFGTPGVDPDPSHGTMVP